MARFRPKDAVQEIRDLYGELKPGETMWLGIDPGMTGAIAFLPPRKNLCPVILDIPTFTKVTKSKKTKSGKKSRTEFDVYTLARLLDPVIDFVEKEIVTIVGLERTGPRPEDTPLVGFSMGMGYGLWHLYFAGFAIRLEEIAPNYWKTKMRLIGQEKDASRARAMRLFPQACHYLAAKGDHNRAEALLIAEALRQMEEGKSNG